MKALLCLLLTACACFGQYMPMADPAWFGTVATPAAASSVSYLIKQGFEGTGYDNGETWTETNDPNEDYTTTALDGSQSLFMDASGAVGRIIQRNFTASSQVWIYLLVRFTKIPEAARDDLIRLKNGSGTTVYLLNVTATGTLQMQDAADFRGSATVGTMSINTTYHVWCRYKKGTGANAELEVAFSSDGTKPTTGDNYRLATNGTATTDAEILTLSAEGSSAKPTLILDKIRLDDAVIGANPE